MVYDLADQVSFVGSMTAPLAFWDAAGAFDYGGAGASQVSFRNDYTVSGRENKRGKKVESGNVKINTVTSGKVRSGRTASRGEKRR